ncbi:hypothetical protein QBC45DRAFT_428913 [Copromyces sp. CBS 386.78]|nr:hypothetical protein QBC45DRAFT_428913 [Copromyces sp. CBS 386.78]
MSGRSYQSRPLGFYIQTPDFIPVPYCLSCYIVCVVWLLGLVVLGGSCSGYLSQVVAETQEMGTEMAGMQISTFLASEGGLIVVYQDGQKTEGTSGRVHHDVCSMPQIGEKRQYVHWHDKSNLTNEKDTPVISPEM